MNISIETDEVCYYIDENNVTRTNLIIYEYHLKNIAYSDGVKL